MKESRTSLGAARSANLPRRRAALVTLGLAASLAPFAAADEVQVGSYVDRERPMYLELDQLIGGEPLFAEVCNLPEDSTAVLLLWSLKFKPVDLTDLGIPGVMGPDMSAGGWIHLPEREISGIAAPEANGATLYLQPLAIGPFGGRLGSMIEVTQANSLPPEDPDPQFPLPLITQEITTRHHSGQAHEGAPVRMGVPFPRGSVFEKGMDPQLTVLGPTSRGQFETLAKWPDGSVKWALVEYLADLGADEWSRAYSVDHGKGDFGGSPLATVDGDRIEVDTGAVEFAIDGGTADLFEYVDVNGVSMLQRTAGNTFFLVDRNDVAWTYEPLGAVLRRNGPVRTEIEVHGAFHGPGANDKVYLRLAVEATWGRPDVRVQTHLRNSAIDYEHNLLFRGFGWTGTLKADGPYQVRGPLPGYDGAHGGTVTANMGAGEEASFYQGFVLHSDDRLTWDHNDTAYTPFLRKVDEDKFAINGVRLRIAGQDYTGSSQSDGFSDRFEYCDSVFLDVTNETWGMGVLANIESARVHWPCALVANGDGQLEVQLFPRKESGDQDHYPLTWGTSETRTFWLHFQDEPAEDPRSVAQAFDYPVTARGELEVYNQSKVWPWHLVDRDALVDFSRHNHLDVPSEPTIVPARTVYRYANGTGSFNNNWIATKMYFLWLRTGDGGALLRSWWEAIYKVDKMPWTFDDGVLSDAGEVQNESEATKHGKFYDGSKHTYLQALPDIAYWRGENYIFDSQRHFVETLLDSDRTSSQPDGNFVMGTYGAVAAASCAILELGHVPELEANLHTIMSQWTQIVYKESNSFGVDTSTKGWQAPVGTRVGEGLNPDGYFITKASGKSNDWDDYGYTTQIWTDYRLAALAYWVCTHYFEQHAPDDPIIDLLRGRSGELYSFPRRAAPDDYCSETGEFYLFDVFHGDAGNPDVDPLQIPGDKINWPKQTNYILTAWCIFYLESRPSESALSYGVELCRSASPNTWDKGSGDPVLNEFIYQWIRHHGPDQR